MLDKQLTAYGSGRKNEMEYFNLIFCLLKRIKHLFKVISKANSARVTNNIPL